MFLFLIEDCEYFENKITTDMSFSQSIGLLYTLLVQRLELVRKMLVCIQQT